MALPPDLLAVYQATLYTVETEAGALGVRIGARSPAIDRLLSERGARSGVFITAWNPLSRLVGSEANEAANRALGAALTAAGLAFLPHIGLPDIRPGDNPGWPPEHGFFVLDPPDPIALGRHWRQNAVVVIERNGPARLVETAPPDAVD